MSFAILRVLTHNLQPLEHIRYCAIGGKVSGEIAVSLAMLTTLVIKDFAIISELELTFDAGMSVLTGETGAGKSIIVNALMLLLGGKSSADLIRNGAQEASVEGLFTVDRSHAPTMAMLSTIGIDLDDDEFVVRRTISRKGRGKIFIGGTLQTLTTLRNLMRTVIDISGQHEHVSLLDAARHRAILDKFAGLEPDVDAFSALFSAYARLRQERDALVASLEERTKRLGFLDYQIEELGNADVKPGEAQAAIDELKRLSCSDALERTVESSVMALYDDDASIVSALSLQISELSKMRKNALELGDIVTALQEACEKIEDAVHDLRRIHVGNASPERIDCLQERLSLIDRLERKYRVKADELPALLDTLKAERDSIALSDERIETLGKSIAAMTEELIGKSARLSEARRKAAHVLSREATQGLRLLAMENAALEIVCQTHADLKDMHATGADEIEFLLSSNPGEPPRPLAKIASGGELSRVLLAIKRAIVDKDDVACYVFDEVDTGIGGLTAAHVAKMLKEVSRCHQVLCITHLASIASYADAHFKVSKFVVNERTQSQITLLTESERVEEIARMLGGTSITDKTLAHAAEMIEQAKRQTD